MSKIKEKIAQLPLSSGVYMFKDNAGEILYIGKATNLRNRVKSYFRSAETRNHIQAMLPKVENIDFQKTDSVLEALILESNLIKKYQPKYNIELKDDKSFVCLALTKEKFPKFIIIRQSDLDKNDKFPMTNDKSNPKSKIQKLLQLKKIFGPYTNKKQLEIALKIMRKIFPFHSNKQETEKGCLDFQIGLCPGPYAGAISKIDYQKNIHGIQMILEGKKKSLIGNLGKEMHVLSQKHEFEKAAEIRNKIFALEHIRDVALVSKDFEKNPQTTNEKLRTIRVEAYDISNISGQNAVGSMVVFENGQPNKNEYRKFKIKTIEGSNDVAMMQEVLLRRFYNNWPMPDLILLDGGQGHFNMAKKLLHGELGLDVDIVAVAKGIKRKNLDFRFEKDKIGNKKTLEILNDKNLVKRIMDEAHRFAIGYHRNLRKNGFI